MRAVLRSWAARLFLGYLCDYLNIYAVKGGHMASSSSALIRFQRACVTCGRGGQRAASRYRDFLASPGRLFTLASLLLLIAPTIQAPYGLANSAQTLPWLYLAAAMTGSVYKRLSALQGNP